MKLIQAAVIRGVIPFIIVTGISLIMNFQKIDPHQVRSTFITGLIITAVAAATVLYEIDTWTLKKQSLVHFGVMLATVFPCLLISGWFPTKSFVDVIKVLGMFLFVGVILWSVLYIVFSKIIKR